MEACPRSQRCEANCGKLAAILQETGELTIRTHANLGGTIHAAGLWSGLAAVVVGLSGCGNGMDAIDRKIDRVLAGHAERLDGGTIVPKESHGEPDLPPQRSLANEDPPSNNPPASALHYTPADENRDFAERLDELQKQSAGADAAAPMSLDLEGCWRQSQKTAREYLSAQDDYVIAAIRLLIERHRWSIRLFADSSVDFSSSQIDGDSSNVLAIVNQLGATKQLPFGGEVAARWVWSATENLRASATDQYVQSSRLVLDGNIPLLRGAGLVAEESRIQAERDLVYAARDFESFRRSFLVSLARDYFDLLQQRDNIASTKLQLERVRSIRDRQQALFEAGRVAKSDVAIAENDVLDAESSLAGANESFLLAGDRFRVRLGLPEGTVIRIEPSEFVLPEPDVTLDHAVAMALDYRLDLQNRRDRLDDTKRGVYVAMNDLLPDLNLRGSVSFPTDASAREGGAVYELDDIQYTAGLTFSLPVDKEAERLALRQSIIGLEQAKRSLDQFRDELIVDVRARVREIERARFSLRIAQARVETALRRKEEQEINADQVDAQVQLDTSNVLLSADRALVQAKTDVRNAVLDYLVATGTMRVKPDGTFQRLPGMGQAAPTQLPPDTPMILPPKGEATPPQSEPQPAPAGPPPGEPRP